MFEKDCNMWDILLCMILVGKHLMKIENGQSSLKEGVSAGQSLAILKRSDRRERICPKRQNRTTQLLKNKEGNLEVGWRSSRGRSWFVVFCREGVDYRIGNKLIRSKPF